MSFDGSFLGLPAALPEPAATTVRLDYTHFSVLMQPDRKLAAVTGVNIHGGLLVEIERSRDRWSLDDRLPPDEQAGPTLYDRNDFDRGHLVRRRDPGWGTAATARQANDDTFFYTNAAPQAARFNQGKELWSGLEDYLLEHAATWERRLSVFTGPVFAATDPEYRGVQIPLQFWKVAAWLQDGALATTGYLLDQSELARQIIDREVASIDAPPLGRFRTFQVPVAELQSLLEVAMPDLVAADRWVPPQTAALNAPLPLTAIELLSTADIVR